MWQESPGLRVLPWQSWKPPKSPAAPPAMLTTWALKEALVTVTDWLGEVVPSVTSPKSNEVGEIRKAAFSTPFPLKLKLKLWPLTEPPVLPVTAPATLG